jgi:hypothetical protein
MTNRSSALACAIAFECEMRVDSIRGVQDGLRNFAMPHLAFPVVAAWLLGAYWIIDSLIRRQRWLRRLPMAASVTRSPRFVLLFALGAAAAPFTGWTAIEGHGALRPLVLILVAMLTWKHVTQDADVATRERLGFERLMLALLAFAIARWPSFLLPWLYLTLHAFGGYQHHGTLPLRLLNLFAALLAGLVAPLVLVTGDAAPRVVGDAFLFVVLVVHASHYVVPAIGKMRLGRRPWSWAVENRLHHVAASAYSWGFARFLAPATATRILRAMKPFDRPLQFATLAIEGGAIVALLAPELLMAEALSLCFMHLSIFLSTGILFWEWIVVNGALIDAVTRLAPEDVALVFGPWSVAAGLALVALLPLRGRLWKPVKLAWWDTPFTQRVHWDVVGRSGRVYGLYNDFMCPHERLFGRVHGYAAVDAPILTYHLGQVYPHDASPHHRHSAALHLPYDAGRLRDDIVNSRGDRAVLAALGKVHGARQRDEVEARLDRTYLRRFFRGLRSGARKSILPARLSWLKAPGGQYYYWGDHPAYRGQEPATKVIVRFREEFFDGERFLRLRDEPLHVIDLERLRSGPRRRRRARHLRGASAMRGSSVSSPTSISSGTICGRGMIDEPSTSICNSTRGR